MINSCKHTYRYRLSKIGAKTCLNVTSNICYVLCNRKTIKSSPTWNKIIRISHEWLKYWQHWFELLTTNFLQILVLCMLKRSELYILVTKSTIVPAGMSYWPFTNQAKVHPSIPSCSCEQVLKVRSPGGNF